MNFNAPALRLGSPLTHAQMAHIERRLHLDLNKWDTQVGDRFVLLPQPLIISAKTWAQLCSAAERLWTEVTQHEDAIRCDQHALRHIGVPRALRTVAQRFSDVAGAPVRSMRFDFHPTENGWQVSEVNSDVPGGWLEASALPELYLPYCNNLAAAPSPLSAWADAVAEFTGDSLVALLNAPGFLEDSQVTLTFARELCSRGLRCRTIQTPAALHWGASGNCSIRHEGNGIGCLTPISPDSPHTAISPAASGTQEFGNRCLTPISPRFHLHRFSPRGVRCRTVQSPAALDWDASGNGSIRHEGTVSVIVRFYQAEWLCALPRSTRWDNMLTSDRVAVINPAAAAISESKRFPLAFAGSESELWKALVPPACDPRDVRADEWDQYVLKRTYSNTGDHVYVLADLPAQERSKCIRASLRSPRAWVAQRRFRTEPVESVCGRVFPCIGVFVLNGRAAGAYVRLSSGTVTDGRAFEAPLMIDATADVDH